MPMRWVPGRSRKEILRDIGNLLTGDRLDRRKLSYLLHEYAFDIDQPDQAEVLTLEEMRKRVLADAMVRCGTAREAARQLGISYARIRAWMRKAGLPLIRGRPWHKWCSREMVLPYRKRERECLIVALAEARGCIKDAAQILGIDLGRFRNMVRRYAGCYSEAGKRMRRPLDGDVPSFPPPEEVLREKLAEEERRAEQTRIEMAEEKRQRDERRAKGGGKPGRKASGLSDGGC